MDTIRDCSGSRSAERSVRVNSTHVPRVVRACVRGGRHHRRCYRTSYGDHCRHSASVPAGHRCRVATRLARSAANGSIPPAGDERVVHSTPARDVGTVQWPVAAADAMCSGCSIAARGGNFAARSGDAGHSILGSCLGVEPFHGRHADPADVRDRDRCRVPPPNRYLFRVPSERKLRRQRAISQLRRPKRKIPSL